MPTTAAPPATRSAFLDRLRASGLLTDAQFAKAAATLGAASASAAQTADYLVQAGALTRFQADRLLSGRADGFVLGQYVIQQPVGRGAMGRVFKATHRAMNRAVAIKVLAPEVTRTPQTREAFDREVRAVARLAHPNLVAAYDANAVGERCYLVLEFVDGPNLDALVKADGPLPVARACDLVRQAADGLAHAHEAGLIHRDIKPANLLVATDRRGGATLKIADFGISRLAAPPPDGAATPPPRAGAILGTPDYVAPEQAQNPAAADPRADLYSLGCVFYFLLTGRPPFPDGTAGEKVRRHQWEEPARVETLRPDVPPAVAALVREMLAKAPKDRPASAAAVAERLRGLEAGGGLAAGMVSFDLPPAAGASGSHSAVTYLTGFHVPPADVSPWSNLTGDTLNPAATGGTLANDPQPEPAPVAAPSAGGVSPLTLLVLAVSVLTGVLLGIAATVRAFGG